MKHPSLYLDWYVHVPPVKYDFRSSGLHWFKYKLNLGEVDLGAGFHQGNPETAGLLAQRYHAKPENLFISSEGASGQNARIIRVISEKNKKKREAIVENPTYEPLLRQVQEHFPRVKRLERTASEGYRLDSDKLNKIVSEKTGLLVLTNPHLPSGAISDLNELKDIMNAAHEHGFYVLCDEIYAEFNRDVTPSIFSVDSHLGIVTTSFSKAYGLGGLRVGIALAEKHLVTEFYSDTLSSSGTASNIVEVITSKLLTEGYEALERNKHKWLSLKHQAEKSLQAEGFEYFPNGTGITYWVKLPIEDTFRWVNKYAIPKHSLATVPGAFFLFRNGYKLEKSNMIRLGLGNINPEKPNLTEALDALRTAVRTYKTSVVESN